MGFAQSTHIANGYKEDIKGKVAVDRELYTQISREGGGKLSNGAVGVEIHGKNEHDVKHLIQLPGFVKLAPGKFLALCMSGEDDRVYVSISAKGKLIAENFPVRNGQNVIVDGDGDLINAKPGKIWEDTEGRKHSIPKEGSSGVNDLHRGGQRTEDRGGLSLRSGGRKSDLVLRMPVEAYDDQEDDDEEEGIYISSISQLVNSLETESQIGRRIIQF